MEIVFLLIVIGFYLLFLFFPCHFSFKLVFKLDKILDRFLDEKKNDKDLKSAKPIGTVNLTC
jgi:hypothetical protein